MAINDIYQLIDRQTLDGQTVLNVYYYKALVSGLSAALLIEDFNDPMFLAIRDIQGADLTHVQYEVINLFDPEDFSTALNGNVGAFAGGTAIETLPVHDTVAFSLGSETRDIKSGRKSYASVPETVVVDGVITNSGYLDDLDTLAEALAEILFDTATGLIARWLPVIVGRIIEGTPPDQTYRLPADAGEAVSTAVGGVVININISTQNSRKPGRGD